MTHKNKNQIPNIKHPYVWLATWFGAGFMRPAPGTWGSLLSIPYALILYKAWGIKILIAAIFGVIAIGLWASQKFDAATGGHDNKMIVIDETAGQWISMLPVLHFYGLDPLMIGLSFILFRFFDILKPWPISWIDKNVPGAAGVMGDDILAGVIAALCILGVHHYV